MAGGDKLPAFFVRKKYHYKDKVLIYSEIASFALIVDFFDWIEIMRLMFLVEERGFFG